MRCGVTLDSIIALLPVGSWVGLQTLRQRCGIALLTKKDSDSLLKKAAAALTAGDSEVATNFLYFGLILNPTRFLMSIRKNGFFRASRAAYDARLLRTVVYSLLRSDSGLEPEVTDYLKSVLSLYEIAVSVREEYEKLRDWLVEEREVGIRGMIGTLDLLCLRRTVEACRSDPERPSRDQLFFSTEQLANGLSMILALYFSELGPLRGNVRINAVAAAEGVYLSRLISGAI